MAAKNVRGSRKAPLQVPITGKMVTTMLRMLVMAATLAAGMRVVPRPSWYDRPSADESCDRTYPVFNRTGYNVTDDWNATVRALTINYVGI